MQHLYPFAFGWFALGFLSFFLLALAVHRRTSQQRGTNNGLMLLVLGTMLSIALYLIHITR